MTSHQIGKGAGCLLVIGLLVTSAAAFAEDDKPNVRAGASLGADPGQATYGGSDAAGGAPPMMIRTSTSNWEFGYHGYLRAPAKFTFDHHPIRRYVMDGDEPQYNSDGLPVTEDTGDRDWRIHTPYSVPDGNYTHWNYTNNLPGQWAEMILSYGNSIAVGNLSVAAWQLTESGWRDPNKQLGLDRAWVTLNFPTVFGKLGGLKVDVGVFGNRYGAAGRYDAGKYDTYIFGRTRIAGETLTANFDLGKNLTLFVEHGVGAKADTLRGDPQESLYASSGREGSWDNMVSWMPWAGKGQHPAIVNHAHAGVLIFDHPMWDELWINAHFLHAFTNSANASDDENAYEPHREQDGKYIIAGGEVKANGAIWGDTYLGFSTIRTDGIGYMPDAIEILHALGGADFAKNFYGGQFLGITKDGDNSRDNEVNPGSGRVNTLAWQYTFSLSRLVWYLNNERFWGQGPDLQIATWGMLNLVSHDSDVKDYLRRVVEKKLKVGAEAMWTPLKNLGVGLRLDHVRPDLDYDINDEEINDANETSYAPFTIISPKIRIKTAFVTHEEMNIQYSRYFWDGPRDEVRAEGPHKNRGSDRNALYLSVNMWW